MNCPQVSLVKKALKSLINKEFAKIEKKEKDLKSRVKNCKVWIKTTITIKMQIWSSKENISLCFSNNDLQMLS